MQHDVLALCHAISFLFNTSHGILGIQSISNHGIYCNCVMMYDSMIV